MHSTGLGVRTVLVCVCLAVLGTSGVVAIHFPALEPLPTLAAAGLASLGAVHGAYLVLVGRVRSRLAVPVAIYLLFCVVAAFVAAVTASAPFAARGFLALVFPVLTVLAIRGAIGTRSVALWRRRRNLVAITLLLVLAANSVVALRQAFIGLTTAELQFTMGGVSTYGVNGVVRTMGLMPTNQDFGFLVACLVPAALVASTRMHGAWRVAFAMVGVVGLVALITSLTRTALIAAAVALVVGVFVWGRGADVVGRTAKYATGLGVIVLSTWYWLSTSQNERVRATFDRLLTFTDLSEDRSFQDRSEIVYPQAFRIIGDHPVGAGAGSAGPLSQQYPHIAPFGELTTDNGYLMIAVQLGVFGALAFIWMLVSTLQVLVAHRTPLRVGAAAAMVALLVAMITAQYWALSAPAAVAATMLGLGLADRIPRAAPAPIPQPVPVHA